MTRNTRTMNDDIFFGGAPSVSIKERRSVPANKNERLLIVPQDVSGEGGGVPWYVWALLIAGVGYLILKQEKIF
jgi:hypothetical protein